MHGVPFPYPTFLAASTRTSDALSLTALGRVRIHPLTCPGASVGAGSNGASASASAAEEYAAIVSKCAQQSGVDASNKHDKDAAKLRKKFMKEGVAMAGSYLSHTLGIDVSIIDVEMVLNHRSIIDTDGCLASCFLDAGCASIVVRVKEGDGGLAKALDVCDVARLPRERLVLHYKHGAVDVVASEADSGASKGGISSRVGTVSVQLPTLTKADASRTGDEWKAILPLSKRWKCAVQLTKGSDMSDDDLASVVSTISKSRGEDRGSISIVDPTVEQLGGCYAACLRSDRPDGMFPTVVSTRSGEALGLVYSKKESIVAALQSGRGVYWSRSRGGLWRKGDSSGRTQTLHRIDADCDGDALRFTVTQNGEDVKAFCHLNTFTCWGEPCGLRHLEGTLERRLRDAPAGSYTKRLFDDDRLLRDKLVEEAQELSEAESKQHVAEELADVIYFAMVRAAKAGVSIDDAVAELDKRSRKVTRRKGDSKAFRIEAGDEILRKKG